MLAALAAILLGGRPKLLVHWHSDVVGKGLLGFLLRPLERAMLRRADRIVCTSQLYADGSNMLRPFLHKVSVVPNGIPDVAARPNMAGGMPEQLKYLIGGRRIILAVGRLVPYKGFGVLIEAALRLPQDAVVVIVGSGHLQEQLRGRIEQLGLRTKVLLTGHVEDSVLDALYRNAALFCLPSVERSEAFGVVIVEAMAYGLPVVATKIPGSGVPWVNMDQESGLNVPVNDPQQLAEACTSILRSPELRGRLSIGARQRYSELFTTAAVNARMLEEYARILSVH
jgi:glycosyltransferase involved in cell wall biosynthesis